MCRVKKTRTRNRGPGDVTTGHYINSGWPQKGRDIMNSQELAKERDCAKAVGLSNRLSEPVGGFALICSLLAKSRFLATETPADGDSVRMVRRTSFTNY